MDIYSELRNLVQALEREAIDYALCGGLAVAFHGYSRFTEDIDLLVLEEDLPRVLQASEGCGFRDSSGKIPIGKDVLYRVLKTEGPDYLVLDVMVAGEHLRQVWDHRELFDWEGAPIWVVSAEGLATMKRRAGRRQDLLDLEELGFSEGEGEDDSQNETS